jgi:hypothetical protein
MPAVSAIPIGFCSNLQPREAVPLHWSNMSAENDQGSRIFLRRKALSGVYLIYCQRRSEALLSFASAQFARQS